ncbi:MAG: MBL fold metallo-hydrolase [Saprospiraceae bacterium]
MPYNITSYSTGLYYTWINVEELNLLVDAGDGAAAGLLQKSRKIKNVFITHPDRDHLNGLPQFVQLNAREGYPKIYHPQDSGSFPAMSSFLRQFDPHVPTTDWIGIADGSRVEIKKDVIVEAIRNEHVKAPIGVHKSLSYKVFERKKKLKPEFLSKSSSEIKSIVELHGRDFITNESETNIISFSGDTPVDDYSKWDGSKVLIHESTFLKNEGDAQIESRGNKHSRIDEVIKMASEISVEQLILTHFSSRYSKSDIDASVRKLSKEYGLQIPIFIVYPGEIKRDILNGIPVNE